MRLRCWTLRPSNTGVIKIDARWRAANIAGKNFAA